MEPPCECAHFYFVSYLFYILIFLNMDIPGHLLFLLKQYDHHYLINFIDCFHSISSLMFINLVSYNLPPNFIWILSNFPRFSHVDSRTAIPSLQSLVSSNLHSFFCTDPFSSLPVTYSSSSVLSWFSPFITVSFSPVPCMFLLSSHMPVLLSFPLSLFLCSESLPLSASFSLSP